MVSELFPTWAAEAGFQYMDEASFARLTPALPIAVSLAPTPIFKNVKTDVPARCPPRFGNRSIAKRLDLLTIRHTINNITASLLFLLKIDMILLILCFLNYSIG